MKNWVLGRIMVEEKDERRKERTNYHQIKFFLELIDFHGDINRF